MKKITSCFAINNLFIVLMAFIVFGFGCSTPPKNATPSTSIPGVRIPIKNLPVVAESDLKPTLYYNGLSSLIIEKETADEWLLTATTDRGPNADPHGEGQRPFAYPKYNPSLIQFKYYPKTNRAEFFSRIPLSLAKNQGVTGLPNMADKDESPIDLKGNIINPDPNGLDTEGLVKVADGSYWLSDEYGPSLIHFSKDGLWLKRFMPRGKRINGMVKTEDSLPEEMANRRFNRGFEGLATDGQKLFVFLQSPFKKKSRNLRILEFDTQKEKVIAQYIYIMPNHEVEKVGDALWLGGRRFLIVELDEEVSAKTQKAIKLLDFSTATNIMQPDVAKQIEASRLTIEKLNEEDFAKLNIKTVAAQQVVSLADAGFTHVQKAEGIALSQDRRTLLIVNDNDFNLSGAFDPKTLYLGTKNEQTEVFKINLPADLAL